MTTPEQALMASLEAIAADNLKILRKHMEIERQLLEMRTLAQRLCAEVDREGGSLALHTRKTLDEANEAVERARERGEGAALRKALETQVRAQSMFNSSWNIRASVMYYKIELFVAVQGIGQPGAAPAPWRPPDGFLAA